MASCTVTQQVREVALDDMGRAAGKDAHPTATGLEQGDSTHILTARETHHSTLSGHPREAFQCLYPQHGVFRVKFVLSLLQ